MVVSIIVPTFNEESHLFKLLSEICGWLDLELNVVDGGSLDNTLEVAKKYTRLVFSSPLGRACQMNLGARHASGDILFFLHADTKLDNGAIHEIQHRMVSGDIVGGAFDLHIDHAGIAENFIARISSLRSRLLRLPYGDQGVFVKRSVFESIGGYPEIPIMEDVAFARKLRRQGKLVFLKTGLVTSGRRWAENGVVKTTLVNWMITFLFFIRVNPQLLRSYYDQLLDSGRDFQLSEEKT